MTDDNSLDGLMSPAEGGPPPPDAAPAAAPGAAPPPPPPPYRPGYAPGTPVAVLPHWVASVPPPVTHRRSPAVTVLLVLGLLLLGFILLGAMMAFFGRGSAGPGLGGDHVGVVAVQGLIRDGGSGGMLSGPPGARGIMEQLRDAAKDDGAKAVVLLIDSPGGSAAASAAIYEEIRRLRVERKKKVVACMTDVAASGGYYIASACDQIVAQGSTLTGSIGVIYGGIGYAGLMQKLGLTDETITAGKYKGMGRGSKAMTAEERAIVVAMLEDIYTQFITAVAEGRNMDPAKVRQLAQGRIYTGSQAKAVGLVDELGNFYDALKLAGRLGNIKGEPKVRYYGQSKSLLDELTGTESHFERFMRGQANWAETPLHGPVLMLPETYWGLGIGDWGLGTARTEAGVERR